MGWIPLVYHVSFCLITCKGDDENFVSTGFKNPVQLILKLARTELALWQQKRKVDDKCKGLLLAIVKW